MPYLGNELATQFQAFVTQTITGDGSTGYTLDRAVANGKELLVYINNVKQEEGSGKSYTASGTTITFSEAVASGDSCYVVFLGSAVQTVVPPDASIVSGMIANANLELPSTLDMNGNELILDADADTSITSDTDDQVDIKIGGTDVVSVTSSGIDVNVTGGSALTLKSTDAGSTAGPVLSLQRDSASPADNDLIGKIIFSADDDGGNSVDYATVNIKATDVSDGSEDGEFDISTVVGGTSRSRIRIDGTETIVNENSVDVDFRAETNNHIDALVVDAGQDHIHFFCSDTPDGTNRGGAMFQAASDERAVLHLSQTTTSPGSLAVFNNSNGIVGTIRTNDSATSFNTSSDYRLKENVVTDWNAITRLKQLKPSRFNFKANKDKTVDGFLAHEVSSIVPEAISGEKDAVDKDGNPDYQGIDQSKLVPLLTKALQEAISEIDTLKEKVKALENK
jgi:hypothetical protein